MFERPNELINIRRNNLGSIVRIFHTKHVFFSTVSLVQKIQFTSFEFSCEEFFD